MTTWQTLFNGTHAYSDDGLGTRTTSVLEAIPSTDTILPYTHTPTPQELIANLESTTTQRMIREAALGTDNNRLKALESQIEAIRATMK